MCSFLPAALGADRSMVWRTLLNGEKEEELERERERGEKRGKRREERGEERV